jgi:diguanylate cyclase (GGDEF)-like protein/PAS domain S-box-containing protein
MVRLRCHLTGWLLLLLAMLAPMPAGAVEVVDTSFSGPFIDLMPALHGVESGRANISIELPTDASGQRIRMPLEARSSGPTHRWAVLHLRNPKTEPENLVLVIPHQGFSDSGVFWPVGSGTRIHSFQISAGQTVQPLRVPGADVLALTINPGFSVTYAIELGDAGLDGLLLWHRQAWDAQVGSQAFFNGAVLGIAILLAIAILCLFIVRRRAVFPAAALFAGPAVVFLAAEMGYLGVLAAWLPFGINEDQLRAAIEGFMLAGITACLVTFLELRRRLPLIAILGLVAMATAMALIGYGQVQPAIATGLIRALFFLVVLSGFGVIAWLWRDRSVRAQGSLIVWSVLTAWTLVAAADCLGLMTGRLSTPVTLAGLVLVLLTMAFTVTQFAFGSVIASGRSFEDIARRALALANSEQSVFDWQVDKGQLFVGHELERSLGLRSGALSGGGLEPWMELIHPADRVPFKAVIEGAERRRRGGLSQEFRLRRADGSYRWYQLRARVIQGDDGLAARIIGTLADVTAFRRSEDRILSDAVRDRVTGLPNRALFIDRLERTLKGLNGSASEVHVVVIDLDRFKAVNDGLGHEVGDSLLHVTAKRLQALTGPDDTLARLPGDQFGLVVQSGRSKPDIQAIAEQIRRTIAQPVRVRAQEIFVTGSLGIAAPRPGRMAAEEVLKDAEIALYEAKRRGKDTIEYFRPGMHDDRAQLLMLEQDLRRAIERSEIEVVYQPIMRLGDRELAGFEALVRWRRGGELLQPAAFLGIAEDTGIIRDLGRYVLNEAARQLGIWQRAFRPSDPLFVAVNVSSAQLVNNELVDEVRTILAREDIRAGTLKLEITESLVMENPELAGKVLARLHQLGVGLACDDFGTGYSALANLRRLPFDTIKIDRSFLDVEPDDEQASIILEAIILLAHDLSLSVVAEGVENGSQVARLSELECDYAQGFFIGEPVTAKQVIEALGGLPYNVAQRRSGMAAFWDRLLGREERTAAALPAPEPEDGPRVQDVADYEEDASGLPRWSAPAPQPPARGPGAGERLPMAPRPRTMSAPPPPPEPRQEAQPKPGDAADQPPDKPRPFGISSFAWRLNRPTVSANDESAAAESPASDDQPVTSDHAGEVPGESVSEPEAQAGTAKEGGAAASEEDDGEAEQAEPDGQNSGAREKARRLRRRLREAARSRSPAGE